MSIFLTHHSVNFLFGQCPIDFLDTIWKVLFLKYSAKSNYVFLKKRFHILLAFWNDVGKHFEEQSF